MPYVDASVRAPQFVTAARAVMLRDGVPRVTMRAVAAEAGVPLGTLQYVFPAKELLMRAVIDDVVEEIAGVLMRSVRLGTGLADGIRRGLTGFWAELVTDRVALQVMQHELLTYVLRNPSSDGARWPYERYATAVAQWCRDAAAAAGEVCAVPFDRLARIILAGVDGLTLQYACDPDRLRASADLDALIDMVIAFADIRPAAAR